jgi:hypothetical protein
MSPSAEDIERIERALGWRPSRFRPAAPARGDADADTSRVWIVATDDRSAFIKIGANELTAGWIRAEQRNYETISGAFMPRAVGFDDDGLRPILAIEDLSACDWPPPWSDRRVSAVLDAFAEIRSTTPPAHLQGQGIDWGSNWRDVAEAPRAFLALRVCSEPWLEASLPILIDAAERAPLDGTSLAHGDMRSDNLCFRGNRALVIDWNHAAVLNPDLDVAAWLPSLHAEGGPAPETILPAAPELAAWLAGFFGSRAGWPPIPDAPHVRQLQLQQVRTALPWAARALGLPPPS